MQIWSGWIPPAETPLVRPARAAAERDRTAPDPPSIGDPGWWEFFHHPSAIGPLRDTEGRPLGERGFAFGPDLDGVSFELRRCLYPGSRYGHEKPMNISALRQLRQHWPDFRLALELLRGLYLERYPPREAGKLSALELWHMCRTIVRLPQYVHRRASHPTPSGSISPLVASILKVVLGAGVTLEHLAVSSMARGVALADDIAPDVIADHAEEHGLLLNAEGVCAGPPKMIEEFLTALVHGAPTLLAREQRGRLDLQLGALAGETDALFAYAREDAKLKLTVNALLARNAASGLRLLARADSERAAHASRPLSERLDAFDAELKERALPYLRCFETAEMEALAAGLEREAMRLDERPAEQPAVSSSASAEARARLRDDLVAHANATGLAEQVASFLADAFVEHLVHERSALRSIAEAQGSIARIIGTPPPEVALDHRDVEAVGGPTVGTLVSDLLGLDRSNTADRTTVRARASGQLIGTHP